MTVTVEDSTYRFANVKLDVPGIAPYREDKDGWYEENLTRVESFVQKNKSLLSDGTAWIINSVAHGGGVAEMLPHHVSLLRDLGIDARWLVYQPKVDGFFSITKRIHNSLHDKDCQLNQDDWQEYDRVSRLCAKDLEEIIGPKDILLVHDLQPLGAAAHYLRSNPRPASWRCHIGYPEDTPVVKAAWDFLAPYTDVFDINVFTAEEYGRPHHKGQRFIPPTLNPASVKNRPAAPIERIFAQGDVYEILQNTASVALMPADLSKMVETPYFLQVARWDHLKGFDTAIEAFGQFCEREPHLPHELILAGPDPRGIADDPEDVECLDYILSVADKMPEHVRSKIRVLLISMDDNDVNAAIIGYLQENAYAVLQLSVQEGFGLSLTEALFKGRPAIVRDAFGLCMQIQDGVNGFIVGGDNIEGQVSNHIRRLALDTELTAKIGNEAQRLCRGNSTQLAQVSKWLQIIVDQKKMNAIV